MSSADADVGRDGAIGGDNNNNNIINGDDDDEAPRPPPDHVMDGGDAAPVDGGEEEVEAAQEDEALDEDEELDFDSDDDFDGYDVPERYSDYLENIDDDGPGRKRLQMYQAICAGDVATVQKLLRRYPHMNGGDVEEYDYEFPMLHAAIAWGGTLPVVQLFMTDKNKNLTYHGRTALHEACLTDIVRMGVLEHILEDERGTPSLSIRDSAGSLLLHLACAYLEPRQIQLMWKLYPAALKVVDSDWETPLMLLVRQKAGGTKMLAHPLLGELLQAWPVAVCIAGKKEDKLPIDLVFYFHRAVGPEIVSDFAQVTLQVFVATAELILDETLSLRSDDDDDECSEFEISKADQLMLRDALADLLVEIDPDVSSIREEIRNASPQFLAGRILALEESTRRQKPPHSLVRRISKLFQKRPRWCELVRKNPKFAELVHAWYDVNRAGRRKILIGMSGLPGSIDQKITPIHRPDTSNLKYQGANSRDVGATVMVRMLETATLRNVGATFLLLRSLPNQYFRGSRRGGSASASPNSAPRTDITDAHRLEQNTGMWYFRVFTKQDAPPAGDRAEAAMALKSMGCTNHDVYFQYAALHHNTYPEERMDDMDVAKYYAEYAAITSRKTKPATQSSSSRSQKRHRV